MNENTRGIQCFCLYTILSLVLAISLPGILSAESANFQDDSVRLADRDGLVEMIAKRSGQSFAETDKLFREIYIAAIDHYYYDPYMVSDLSFCKYFSTVLGIIDTESMFDPFAVAGQKKYARRTSTTPQYTGVGLMQINFQYWKTRLPALELQYLYNPYINVRIGSRILMLNLRHSKTLKKALALYVGGSQYTTTKARKYIEKVENAEKLYYEYVCGSDASS